MNLFLKRNLYKNIKEVLKSGEKDKIINCFKDIVHKYSFDTILSVLNDIDEENLTNLFYYVSYLESFADVDVALKVFDRFHLLDEHEREGLSLLFDDLEKESKNAEYILLGMYVRCDDVEDMNMFYSFSDGLCKRKLDKYIYAWLTCCFGIPREYNGLKNKREEYYLLPLFNMNEEETLKRYKHERKQAIDRIIMYIIETKNVDLAFLVLDNLVNAISLDEMYALFDVLNDSEDNLIRERVWNINYSRILLKIDRRREEKLYQHAILKNDENLLSKIRKNEVSPSLEEDSSFFLKLTKD